MAIQLRCPFCKSEFPFDNEELDRDTYVSEQRYARINKRLHELKMGPYTGESWEERRKLIREKNWLEVHIADLKTKRAAIHCQERNIKDKLFRRKVKEIMGDKEYQKMWEQIDKEAEEETKAYTIGEMMRGEYTRSGSLKNVININKL